MTQQQAINMLRCLHLLAEEQETKEAILMAIGALKQQDKRCKICKYFHDINIRLFNYYCPNCGAKMEVVEQ